MPRKRLIYAAIAALLLVMPGVLPRAAEPAPDPPAGQLLIASASIQDPRFYHCVILIVRHNHDGAFGIAINKPLAERPIGELLVDGGAGTKDKPDTGSEDSAIKDTIRVFLGGPVQPQLGFVIHTGDYRRGETVAIAEGLAMTATKEVLRDIGGHRGPAKYLFALGYAGWGAGQLEGEIARHDWFTEPAEPDLVFDLDRDTVWEKAVARRTREL